MGITAIETVYNGYKFRSRLEARWAVFFDAVGIEYEYEPEGLILSDGTPYLPDFYLPQFHSYFEVKSKHVKGTPAEKEARRKISDGSHCDTWSGIICFGDTYDHDMTIYCQDVSDSSGGSYEGRVVFGYYLGTRIPMLFAWDDCRDRTFLNTFESSHTIPMQTDCGYLYTHNPFVTGEIINAELTARQARFEHGEAPKPVVIFRRKPNLEINKMGLETLLKDNEFLNNIEKLAKQFMEMEE
jgi:hypothetical protein